MLDDYGVGCRFGRAVSLPRDSGVCHRERLAAAVSHTPRNGVSFVFAAARTEGAAPSCARGEKMVVALGLDGWSRCRGGSASRASRRRRGPTQVLTLVSAARRGRK
jgi:hypothetical protein